ncbi:hypothetical protein Pfo_002044 [Paulownia fortunei]|nr:hypothetical protein Pfo_002044 [Paulownia fortunei]
MAKSLPIGFKIANLTEFDGIGDPQDHLDKFYAKANLYDLSDAVCKIFRTTLPKRALTWFNELLRESIYPKTAVYLFTITQKDEEPLCEFVQCFVEVVHEVPYVNHDMFASIMQQNLRHGKFKESITERPSTMLEDLLARAEKRSTMNEKELRQKRNDERRHGPPSGYTYFTPLNARLSDILVVVEQQGLVQLPQLMRENPKRIKSNKYCSFHRDFEHTTEECHHLKNKVNGLIRNGYLTEHVNKAEDGHRHSNPNAPRP